MVERSSETLGIFDGFLHLIWRPWRVLSAIAMMLMELSWSVAWFLGSFAAAEFGDLIVAVFYFLLQVLLILGLIIVSPLVFLVLLLFSLLENRLQTSPLFQEIQEQVASVIEQIMEILSEVGSLLKGFLESFPVLPFVKPALLWFFVGLLLMLILRTERIHRRRSVSRESASDAAESFSNSGGGCLVSANARIECWSIIRTPFDAPAGRTFVWRYACPCDLYKPHASL